MKVIATLQRVETKKILSEKCRGIVVVVVVVVVVEECQTVLVQDPSWFG